MCFLNIVWLNLFLMVCFCGNTSGARSNVEPGKHCVDIPDPTGSGYVEACASCFFQQNCLDTNVCLTGSEGELCERCVHFSDLLHTGHKAQGYYRVGNTCVPCLAFPWALVVLAIFTIIWLWVVAYNSLTPSLATKIKQGLDFFQYVILCFSIKVAWSNTITRTALVFTFSYFSTSAATPSCLVSQSPLLYFMEWGVTVAIVAISLILMWVLDLRKESRLKKGGIQVLVQKKLWRKRAVYRRFAYLILMIFYVPVTTSAIQSFSCTAGLYPESLTLHRGQGLFLYDMRINCDEVGFSAMNSLITLIMVAHTCLLPLLVLFFTLRQKKWGFLQCKMIQYGPVYETYKERWCFWETLVMLRKIVYILLTNTYPISPVYQAIGHLCVTGTFLLATVIFRPFRKFTWNRQMLRMLSPSIIFEVLSNFSLILLETQGLLIAYGITVPALDAAFVISLAVALVCWLTIILAVEYEKNLAVFEDFEVPLVEKRSLFLVEEDNSQSKDAARRRIDEVRLLGTRVQPVGSGNHPDASASRSKGLTHKNGQARKLYATRERENKSIDKIALGLKGHDNTVEKSQEKLHKRPWNANDPEKDAEKCRQAVGEVKAFEKTLEHQKKRAGETKAPETSVVTEEDNEQKHVKSQDELLLVLDVDREEPFTSSHVPVPSDQQINSRKGGREGTPDPPENLFDDSSNTSLF